MQCGNCENHPVDPSMSLFSTTGVLRRSSSDLSIHRGNGCRAITKDESLGKGVIVPRIELLDAEASLGARETERPSRKGAIGDLPKRSKVVVSRAGEGTPYVPKHRM